MLIGSFAFASSNNQSELYDESGCTTVIYGNSSTGNCVFNVSEDQLILSEFLAEKECTMKAKITVTTADGSRVTVEGTITIVGQTCAELLKELMKK